MERMAFFLLGVTVATMGQAVALLMLFKVSEICDDFFCIKGSKGSEGSEGSHGSLNVHLSESVISHKFRRSK